MEPLGPGSFDPRHSLTSRSAPSIGFGSGSRWKDLPKMPKRKDGNGSTERSTVTVTTPGPGAYEMSSSNRMFLGKNVVILCFWFCWLMFEDNCVFLWNWPVRNPMAVTIKGPWPERDRDHLKLQKSEKKKDEAPVGPGPPISSFKPRRFSS